LALLAHSRDGVFFFGEGITEAGSITLAHNARGFSHSTNTGNASKVGKHLLNLRVLESSREVVGLVLHDPIILYLGEGCKENLEKLLVVSVVFARV